MPSILPDPSTPFGRQVAARLQDDVVIWFTSVGDDGTPQPRPVWFLWDGESLLTYNRAGAGRVAHIRERPRVALNFAGGNGGHAVIIGRAEFAPDAPPPDQMPAYLQKYRDRMVRVSGSPERFAQLYPVAIRVHPMRIGGY